VRNAANVDVLACKMCDLCLLSAMTDFCVCAVGSVSCPVGMRRYWRSTPLPLLVLVCVMGRSDGCGKTLSRLPKMWRRSLLLPLCYFFVVLAAGSDVSSLSDCVPKADCGGLGDSTRGLALGLPD
jgi:hypothetical protein